MRTVLLLFMLMSAIQTPQTIPIPPRVLPNSNGRSAAASPTTPDIFGDIDGVMVRETPHFQIYVEKGYLPVDLDWLQAELETIHVYLSGRMGVVAGEKFAVTFRPPDSRSCPIRGLARFESAVAQAIVFAEEKTGLPQIAGVLAHEIAHLFHIRAMKAGNDNLYMTEGLATWGAGKYWEEWKKAALPEQIRAYRRDGSYIPLADYYRADVAAGFAADNGNCLNDRDLRYTSWAAFIDFLVTNYGMEKFRQLLGPLKEPQRIANLDVGAPGRQRGPIGEINILEIFAAVDLVNTRTVIVPTPVPPLPDFSRVYGVRLDELEKLWQKQLDGTDRVPD